MICRNCLRNASRARIPILSTRQAQRFFTTTSSLANATPISATAATQTAPPHTPPTANSPNAASPDLKVQTAKVSEKKATPLVKSSIPAGQPLKGLNFLKNAQDPVALPDDEYPEWLWTILDRQEKKDETGAGDLFSKSKKQRRVAAKRLRKEQALHPEMLIPKVPIYEQTIDLPAGDGSVAGAAQAADARDELTKAMRNKRRAMIKEANFLKAMG